MTAARMPGEAAGGPETRTRWFGDEAGRVWSRTVTAPEAPGGGPLVEVTAPAGAVEITAAQAATRLAAIHAANAEADAERARLAAVRAESEYHALIHLGIPGALAARLTGHRPAGGRA